MYKVKVEKYSNRKQIKKKKNVNLLTYLSYYILYHHNSQITTSYFVSINYFIINYRYR